MSLYYFIFFTAVAVFSPYFNLYLTTRGLSSSQVGVILAVMPLVGLLVQPLWGILNDWLHLQRITVFIGLAAASLLILTFPHLHGFLSFLFAVAVLAVFQTGMIPVMDSLTVQNTGVHHYGKVRMFGSLGYAIMVSIAGQMYRSGNVNAMIPLYATLAGLSFITLIAYPKVPATAGASVARKSASAFTGLRRLVKNRGFVWLLLFTMLVSISQTLNSNFFTLYYHALHRPLGILGIIYSIGGLSELPLFFVSGRLITRFGAERMLLVASSVFLFRWIVLVFGPPTWVLVCLQTLHGLSFGIALAAGISVASRVSDETNRVTAQTVYSAVNTGLAAIIGSMSGGFVLGAYGPYVLYGFAAGICALGVVGMAILLTVIRRESSKPVSSSQSV
ncbi:MFS transporter [Alicyclobacillus curvatus]|jgi:MFS transporter, PPP family, 3-phenylpropionic acid transporter|nr:MFS transporter [Alicyclobacillus curvatus]